MRSTVLCLLSVVGAIQLPSFPRTNGASPSAPRARLPRHLAVIPDGNSRWARQEGRPRRDGHLKGVSAMRKLVESCVELDGVDVLTVYAMSMENWQRPPLETAWLLDLVAETLERERERLREQGVSVRLVGELEQLSPRLRDRLRAAAGTPRPDGPPPRLLLCVAISYGGRHEVARVARELAERVSMGELRAEAITEALFSDALRASPHSAPSDPDFLIRTGGQHRLSNFLLYQAAYTELHVTDVLWPDFGPRDLHAALAAYTTRQRNFGKRLPADAADRLV